jgi:RHS repeat-associated protein
MYPRAHRISPYTGQNQDTESSGAGGAGGLYDFLYREHSPVQGRWLSPDPWGLAAVSPSDPQSWNRYAYVGNRPTNSIDPLGLLIFGGCSSVGDETTCIVCFRQAC